MQCISHRWGLVHKGDQAQTEQVRYAAKKTGGTSDSAHSEET